MGLPICTQNNIKKGFNTIQTKEYFGLINKLYSNQLDITSILNQIKEDGLEYFNGVRFNNFHLKSLDDKEMNLIPSQRFTNSVLLYDVMSRNGCWNNIPEPVGLLYLGGILNLLSHDLKGVFITKFKEGDNMYKSIEKLNENEKEIIYNIIGSSLHTLRDKGVYLFDFAPRDIILERENFGKLIPILVDTEDVEIMYDYNWENIIIQGSKENNLLKKQISQFKKDYAPFLAKKELKKAVELVFGKKLSTSYLNK